MSVPASSTAADLLRDLQRAPASAGACAVRLQMRVPAGGRRPWLRALFRQPLEPLEGTGKVRSYALADTDHVVLCDDLSLDLLDHAIVRLNEMLPPPGEEPRRTDEAGADATAVNVTWFDLSRSEQRAEVAGLAADAAAADARAEDSPLRPIRAGDLVGLANLLTSERIAPLLRRQRVLLIRSATEIRPLYAEIAISASALQRELVPGIDLDARPSLLRCLGERLDRATLAALTGPGAHIRPPTEPFSLGLGLTSLVLPEFAAFAASLAAASEAPRQALIQFCLDDVLADFDAFAAARDWLHGEGFRVVLHGLSPATLEVLDPADFGADFFKVRFPAGTRDACGGSPVERLSGAVRRIGRERLIFADIDSEATVMEALCLGVRRFQGRFIDTLVAAMLAKGWL